MYSRSDATSLEFHEKESDTAQLTCILTKLTLAAVWRLDYGASLETGRPVRILRVSNLEIMLATEVARRVEFLYVIKATGLVDGLDMRMATS